MDVIQNALARHRETMERSIKILPAQIEKGGTILLEAARQNRRLYICGNGGSAADSQHFAAEWMCRYKDDRIPLPAIALTTDTSVLTAISNDYAFDDVFSRQIQALGNPGDVLVAFTTSGRSPNILKAIEAAKRKKMAIIVLTGEGGKELETKADCVLAVPSGETARIQEIHELIYHIWCEYIDAHMARA
ncbi:MAG: SIS domain-containing protein [Patescibacteria group bacterium]